MFTVDEALAAILSEFEPPSPVRLPLIDALDLVMAEDVYSDVDSPPFDKSLLDGFAVRAADIRQGRATLRLVEEISAGQVPSVVVGSGETTQIMTGAPLPEGADAVIRIEDSTRMAGGTEIDLDTKPVHPGDHILKRGTALKRGECVVPAGRQLRPQEVGLLAEVGRHEVGAFSRPRIGVLATGDELVPIDVEPKPGQIRNSNESMLIAQISRAGATPVPLGIARDDRDHLWERIHAGLQCDLLILSGGVSAGVKDLVPSVLQAAGVRQVFHKVRVKPGKPVWFGVLEVAPRRYVFGLPGNPVSSMVCFELFVRPLIRGLLGLQPVIPSPVSARLQQEHLARGDRPTYHPARLDWMESGPVVQCVRWHGSADLRATVDANSMALFPAGERNYQPGDRVDVFPW